MGAAASRPLHRWRWPAALWLAAWIPLYAAHWGWRNFLALCDVAVALTCVGIWRGSALLLSSQALPSFIIGALWLVDVAARLLVGSHPIGGTEYMWDTRVPLAVRLISMFHVALPAVLLLALRRTGYDRRGFALQTGLTALLLVASRVVGEYKNLNYAFRDPFLGRAWGPPAVHLLVILAGAAVLVYLPTHLILSRRLPASGPRA